MNSVEKTSSDKQQLIAWFEDIGLSDLPRVGGKNASLGEMYTEMAAQGVRVPNGFAVTAAAYDYFIAHNDLGKTISDIIETIDKNDIDGLKSKGHTIREAIINGRMPEDLAGSIADAYATLNDQREGSIDVAVRSSATAEDLPDASFAGQQETYLNVKGAESLIQSIVHCFASLYTDRAISYRIDKGFTGIRIAVSVGVQEMVRSDKASAGVMFSLDTESGCRDVVLITAAYGLGENVVQGAVDPDEFMVFKPGLRDGLKPIIRRRIGSKAIRMVYDDGGNKKVKNLIVEPKAQESSALNDDELLQLANWAVKIEKHYTALHGKDTPMDIEWAKDGNNGLLYIVQARPETVKSQDTSQSLERYIMLDKGQAIVSGRSVGERISSGPARVINHVSELGLFQEGEVLIADITDPDWEPIMKKAAAIVTNRGGRTCHAAIISRELQLPAVVGCGDATDKIQNGDQITVSCAEGENGQVYPGLLSFDVEKIELDELAKTRTKVMMNIANPENAFQFAKIPNDGVGLARMEFIINKYIKVHPMALIHPERLSDARTKIEIDELTKGYEDKSQFFIDRLAEGVGSIGAAFYPRDVIVRMSDFKSNEYANLVGGDIFEPKEENPMIGFRGASRYYDPRYQAAFELECAAMKKVRDEMGLDNIKLMIPFCRTVEEGKKVISIMNDCGLKQGENNLEIYVMCEIPSNVLSAQAFAEVFDGFSIGSNDLTQLTMGVDRDSELIAHLFDERNPAVMDAIAMAIKTVKSAGKKIGICGQAPSDYPEFAQFLVEQGIDSISLNPDAVLKTTLSILEAEEQLS